MKLSSSCLALGASFALVLGVGIAACGDDDPPASSTDAGAAGEGGGGNTTPTAGCGAAGSPTGESKGTIDVEGTSRSYELFVPPSHDGKQTYPLVLGFHGDGGNGAGARRSLNIEDAAAGKAIFVYPDGANQTWNLDDKADANSDIKLVDAILADLGTKYCVDSRRVFVAGFSRGAYFANQLGCRRGSKIRGVAAFAGGGPFGADDEYGDDGQLVCPEPSVAALIVHGDSDGNVDVSEGQKSRDEWKRVNGCADTTSAYDPSPCKAFDGCAAGKPVVYCEIPGLGHGVWDQGAKTAWSFFSSL